MLYLMLLGLGMTLIYVVIPLSRRERRKLLARQEERRARWMSIGAEFDDVDDDHDRPAGMTNPFVETPHHRVKSPKSAETLNPYHPHDL